MTFHSPCEKQTRCRSGELLGGTTTGTGAYAVQRLGIIGTGMMGAEMRPMNSGERSGPDIVIDEVLSGGETVMTGDTVPAESLAIVEGIPGDRRVVLLFFLSYCICRT